LKFWIYFFSGFSIALSFKKAGRLMKILITGNMGYVGPVVVAHLRKVFPDAYLVGYDMGYFTHCLTGVDAFPENKLDSQFFGDTRKISKEFVSQFDTIVHLAAISNDPMGRKFEAATEEINFCASANLVRIAADCGVKRFVFASSCSIYGYSEGEARSECDALNPITAYAHSKIATENELQKNSHGTMVITSLRFATACGMSERLRLDLVLNDFVTCAFTSKHITILSNGSPWRPLINVIDMARAIEWAIVREKAQGGSYLAINVGTNESNFQVIDLAKSIAEIIPNISITINKDAPIDKRSYRVNFSLFRKLAPMHQPLVSIEESIKGMLAGLERMKFSDMNFRSNGLVRLKVLEEHVNSKRLDQRLSWI